MSSRQDHDEGEQQRQDQHQITSARTISLARGAFYRDPAELRRSLDELGLP